VSDDIKVTWFGDDLLKQIEEATPDGLFAGGQILVEAAAARAPRHRGNLAKSGYVAIEGKSTYRKQKLFNREAKPPKGGAVVGFAAFYARYQEFGTKNQAAHPFLRPALDELKERIGAAIVVKMRQEIK